MEKPLVIEGRVWVLRDSSSNPIDNIDTDQIYHNAHLAVTDVGQMGKFAFGNLEGWEDFPERVERGDLVVVDAGEDGLEFKRKPGEGSVLEVATEAEVVEAEPTD